MGLGALLVKWAVLAACGAELPPTKECAMHLQLHARMTPRPSAGKSNPSITQVLGQAAYTACKLSTECASKNTEAAPPPPPPELGEPWE